MLQLYRWHTDTVAFDYVVLLTDPKTFEGGKFQFFKGVATNAKEIAINNNNNLPEELIVKKNILFFLNLNNKKKESPLFPNAGWAIFQQGNKVCHR